MQTSVNYLETTGYMWLSKDLFEDLLAIVVALPLHANIIKTYKQQLSII